MDAIFKNIPWALEDKKVMDCLWVLKCTTTFSGHGVKDVEIWTCYQIWILRQEEAKHVGINKKYMY